MNRPVAVSLVAIVLAAAGLTAVIQRATVRPLGAVPENNPGHFVPSDVSRLASSGRPQLVELFHYG